MLLALIVQWTTALNALTSGYNPRGNAIVERFMHTLGHMLRIPSNDEYNNLKDYLQWIAFAHNCTYSSVIECTPFDAYW